jgi:hypothetical protein
MFHWRRLPEWKPTVTNPTVCLLPSLYCPQDRGCGHVPNALRANRAYATRLGRRHHKYIRLQTNAMHHVIESQMCFSRFQDRAR